ncbi:transposable element Tcb1 transposase [Trichonephila clavipes]|nr:transposable element Tcb1 transposase [Trichonephila clavipes]
MLPETLGFNMRTVHYTNEGIGLNEKLKSHTLKPNSHQCSHRRALSVSSIRDHLASLSCETYQTCINEDENRSREPAVGCLSVTNEKGHRKLYRLGTAIRGFSSGHPRGTPFADDRYIVLQARRNRRQTAGEIARHTTQATGRPISRFTVARRLHGGGLFARRPVRCVPLTPAHRRRRSLWCREHRNWRDNEWGRVPFTDESRFSLSSDFHRILIWRERGSHNHPSNIIERDR